MFDTSPDHIHVQPNNKDTVSYYIGPCIGIQGSDSDNRCCNYRTFHRSFASECRSSCCHMVLNDHMARNCIRDWKRNLSSAEPYGSALAIGDASSSSCAAVCSPDECLRMEYRSPLFGQIRTPTGFS